MNYLIFTALSTADIDSGNKTIFFSEAGKN
jgi:hypothetical protein